MEWLSADGVPPAELPPWALPLPAAPGVEPRREGFVVRDGRRASAVPWEAVLALVEHEGVLYVAAPRPPPNRPWFEVRGSGVAALATAYRQVKAAALQRYRDAPPTRATPPLDPREIQRRVQRKLPIPGALEVRMPMPPSRVPPQLVAAGGGAVVGFGNLVAAGLEVALIAGLVGAVGGAAVVHFTEWNKRRNRPRVLVLTPDAFVGGLDGGTVQVISWSEVGAFRTGRWRDQPALVVTDRDGEVRSRTAAAYFDAPLELMVALAEAYRERVQRPAHR